LSTVFSTPCDIPVDEYYLKRKTCKSTYDDYLYEMDHGSNSLSPKKS